MFIVMRVSCVHCHEGGCVHCHEGELCSLS